jgi:osmotically-inducible protein OsmY
VTKVGQERQPDAYLVERIRHILANDPRVAELGICVSVAGDRVLLTGEVATPERKRTVADVVAPLTEGRRLHNGLAVSTLSETDEWEAIE